MDIKSIQLEVFKQTGKNIDPDDPFYVALAMLSEMANIIENKNDTALSKLQKASVTYHQTRSYWHNQNEQLMIEQVKQVKSAVLEITALEAHLTEAAANQAQVQLQPVLASIDVVLKKLQSKDGFAIEQLRKTSDIQERWSNIAQYLIIGFFASALIFFLCGYYVGNLVSSKQIAKNAEWLDSEDGTYALQLRDAGSLKQLATCNTSEENSGWKLKDRNLCIPSPIRTEKGYLTTGWKTKL